MAKWTQFVIRARRPGGTAFWNAPWNRFRQFLLAVFLLFSIIGFFDDLMTMGRMPVASVLVLAAFTGFNAVLWVLVVARGTRLMLVLLIAGQFLIGPFMNWLLNGMKAAFALRELSPETGVHFAGIAILVVMIASYVYFVGFFRAEGIETARIRNQLELAHSIQATLVPPVTLSTPHFEVYGLSQPSEKVGGDLVDALLLPNGDLIAYLADIAGHGLSAGILMGMLKTAARTVLLDAEMGPARETLPQLLEKLNRVLPAVKEPQMYATLTAFRLNADGAAWVATAASPPMLHWRPQQKNFRVMEEEQFPLGLLPVSGFAGEPMDVAPGDLLIVATDGVLEVCDRAGDEFGLERLQQAIATRAEQPLPAIAEAILADVRQFGKQTDDQTLLLIRRR